MKIIKAIVVGLSKVILGLIGVFAAAFAVMFSMAGIGWVINVLTGMSVEGKNVFDGYTITGSLFFMATVFVISLICVIKKELNKNS